MNPCSATGIYSVSEKHIVSVFNTEVKFFTLKREAKDSSETLVIICQTTGSHTSEDGPITFSRPAEHNAAVRYSAVECQGAVLPRTETEHPGDTKKRQTALISPNHEEENETRDSTARTILIESIHGNLKQKIKD
jgi:hypothetical protein